MEPIRFTSSIIYPVFQFEQLTSCVCLNKKTALCEIIYFCALQSSDGDTLERQATMLHKDFSSMVTFLLLI